MAVAIENRSWNPYRLSFRLAIGLFLLSIFIHASILLMASKNRLFPEKAEVAQIPVELLFNPPAVDTRQETAKEKPQDARFQSSRNLKADEDVSPESAPSNVAQKRGKELKTLQPKVAKRAIGRSEKIMSFTQEELLAKGEIQKESLRGDGGRMDSSGFVEKLKRGAELKISAIESVYGQYITRMKTKIAQQWSPQRTISAAMYGNNQIQVDLAVILDERGEIVDIRIIGSSGFSTYDSETTRAVRDAAPFPNPPKILMNPEDHLIYMPWSFTVFMNQGAAYRLD